MSFFEFPNTRTYDSDLGWVIAAMKALKEAMETFIATNALNFAEPLLHDLTIAYNKNTIVLDPMGNAYLSIKAVPAGIGLSNTEYWLMVFDYEAFLEKVNKNFTGRYYRNTNRATSAMSVGDWLTFDDVLCKVTATIAVDDLLEIGVNIEHFTLEDFIKAFMQSANQLIQQYKNDIDASELAYRNQLAQDIANTTASLQAQLNLAISGVTVDSEVINARLGADGVTYPTLGDAIRTQFTDVKDAELFNNIAVLYGQHGDSTFNGITYDWTGHICHVSGTASAGSFNSIINRNTSLPDYIQAGKTYKFVYQCDDKNVYVEFLVYKNSVYQYTTRYNKTGFFTLPADATGIVIRLYVPNGATVDGYILPIVYEMPGYTDYVLDNNYKIDQYDTVINTKSTNPVVINDCALNKKLSVEIVGGDSSTQTTWSNKNLFAINPAQSSFTQNGVNFAFNKELGRIRVTAVGGATGTAVSSTIRETLNGHANIDVNYTFTFKVDTIVTISSNANVFRPYNAKWYLQITDGSNGYFEDGNGLTFKALAGVKYGLRVIVQSGFITDSNGIEIFPQLEINDSKTEFEPHTGGTITGNNTGSDNIFTISHDVTASSSGVSWELDRIDRSVKITSDGATSNVAIYDSANSQSHGFYNLFKFTPASDTFVFLYGALDDRVLLQISDGTNWFSDSGRGVGLIAVANTEYFVRAIAQTGFAGDVTLYPKLATELSGIIGQKVVTIFTNDGSDLLISYNKRASYDQAHINDNISTNINYISGGKILNPFKNKKAIVSFIDDDTTSVTDVNNYASVFTALDLVGTYAVMTRNVEASSALKDRLLELETAGFGMLFHCEYQEGAETNYFEYDSNRDMELVRENITLGLRQMSTYGFLNYKHWVTPYGVNDKDIVDVAKDYGLESLISMSNNSWVANTGNVSRYNIPRLSVSISTPADFPAIKKAAEGCLAENGWLVIVTHANTWRTNNVVPEMQQKLTDVINYLTGLGFEVAPYARAYESRKGMFYYNDLLD